MPESTVIFVDAAVSGNGMGQEVNGLGVYIPALDIRRGMPASRMTNNEAEYSALIYGLDVARSNGLRRVTVYSDSALVVNQVLGNWKLKKPHLKRYLDRARECVARFEVCDLRHIRGHGKCEDPELAAGNDIADRLAVEAKKKRLAGADSNPASGAGSG